MKTAKETAIKILQGVDHSKASVSAKIKYVFEFLKDFEKEIRKDENKITRHVCAEAVSKIELHAIDGTQFDTGVREALKSVHQAIMNVNAVKKV